MPSVGYLPSFCCKSRVETPTSFGNVIHGYKLNNKVNETLIRLTYRGFVLGSYF